MRSINFCSISPASSFDTLDRISLIFSFRRSDLEFRAQQISHKRILLSQQLEDISTEYERALSNRQMTMQLGTVGAGGKEVNLTYAALVSGAVATSLFNGRIKRSSVVGTDIYDGNNSYFAYSNFRKFKKKYNDRS